tara:strand:- start:1080 stop:1187 length:108 start_codon:yes stop_codon:yes gene_type:complete
LLLEEVAVVMALALEAEVAAVEVLDKLLVLQQQDT